MHGSAHSADVIIIDRNATVRRMMARMLEPAGFVVLEAEGVEDLRVARGDFAEGAVVFIDVSADPSLVVDFSTQLPSALRDPKRTVVTSVKPALVESLCPPNRPRPFMRILGRPFRPTKLVELFEELFPGRSLTAPEPISTKTPDWDRLGRRLAEPDGMFPPSGELEVVSEKTVAADSGSRPMASFTSPPPPPRHAATVVAPDTSFQLPGGLSPDDAAFEIETRAGIVDPILHMDFDADVLADDLQDSGEFDLRAVVEPDPSSEGDLPPIDIDIGDSDDQAVVLANLSELRPAVDMATADFAVAGEAADLILSDLQVSEGRSISDILDVTTEKSAAEIARLLVLAEKELAAQGPPPAPDLPPPDDGFQTGVSPVHESSDPDAIVTADEHALGSDLLDLQLDEIELEELPAEFVQPLEEYSDDFPREEMQADEALESVPPPAPSMPAHVIDDLSAQGALRVWPLGDIFSHVANRGYQGSIDVVGKERSVVILVDGSSIAWAEPGGAAAPRSTIDFMLRTQLVTEETAIALAEADVPQPEIPQLLVSQGIAAHEEVYEALAWQVMQFVWEALSLVDARFELRVGLDAGHAEIAAQRPLLQVDAKATLFQFYRSFPDALPVRVNNPGERFVTRSEAMSFHGLGGLLPEEDWALQLLREPRTQDGLLELAADNGYDPDVMLTVLARLCEIGLVMPLRRSIFSG